MNPKDLLRKAIADNPPPHYPPADAGCLRMDANTNLIGLNPVISQVLARAQEIGMNHYPTAFSDNLRAALSDYYAVPPENLIVGNGSDELFDFIVKAYINPGEIIAVPSPTFVMHPFYGRINLGQVEEAPLTEDFGLNVDGLLARKAKLTIVASPNNPTGNAFLKEALEKLLRDSKGIVVIDEAYAEYGDQDFFRQAPRHENLIVTRTFSKGHGLAGLRIGYAVGPKEIIEPLYRVKPPFTVNVISEHVAIAALRNPSFLHHSVGVIRQERVRVSEELRHMGLLPVPTDANFLLVGLGRDSRTVRDRLKSTGILVRDMSDFPGLGRYLRVTLGTPEHNDRFLKALRTCLN